MCFTFPPYDPCMNNPEMILNSVSGLFKNGAESLGYDLSFIYMRVSFALHNYRQGI